MSLRTNTNPYRRSDWQPMTAEQAHENVAAMSADTRNSAQIALFKMALQMPQNFTPAALEIYTVRLAELESKQ